MIIGAPDPSLTPNAGLTAVSELVEHLNMTATLDTEIGPLKQRDRGITGAELLVSLASAQMTGGDHLVSLDRLRADTAGQELVRVPTPAWTTAAGVAGRFTPEHLAGIEAGLAVLHQRVLTGLGQVRRSSLLREVTLDVDATDVEVYGPTKSGCGYTYQGQRAYRPDIAFWAELGVPVAADLLSGNDDPRASAVGLLRRALARLPAQAQRVRVRMDAGYFAGEIARECLFRKVGFAIGAKRNTAVWRAALAIPEHAWVPTIGMDHAELACCDYIPDWWPADTACVVRRVRIPIEAVSADPRARRRRTIPTEQLALALEGKVDHVYGYSFILTNLDVSTEEKLAWVEWWYRHRTDIEALNKDAKHGAALRHLPSADLRVNTVWMWAALLATALSAWLQELTGIDRGNGRGRRGIARLRRELFCVPARVVQHARRIELRLPPGPQLLAVVLARLRALPVLA
ncbi:MAG TPA: IS1380 family transposase [Pseudonocardiaceae bacterium]|nr:IS1380 family transposase [Pseudonocardiaceae bacterium]